jgi:hypothetical protein
VKPMKRKLNKIFRIAFPKRLAGLPMPCLSKLALIHLILLMSPNSFADELSDSGAASIKRSGAIYSLKNVVENAADGRKVREAYRMTELFRVFLEGCGLHYV